MPGPPRVARNCPRLAGFCQWPGRVVPDGHPTFFRRASVRGMRVRQLRPHRGRLPGSCGVDGQSPPPLLCQGCAAWYLQRSPASAPSPLQGPSFGAGPAKTALGPAVLHTPCCRSPARPARVACQLRLAWQSVRVAHQSSFFL